MSRYLIANWKMNLPPEGLEAWLDAVSAADAGDVTRVVAPPFPFLRDAVARRGTIAVGAQNCSDHVAGAFTGEVAPAMLRACGADYVIAGHSERRNLFFESDALVARKLALAIDSELMPVLCIGEDLKVRDAGRVRQVLADQIKETAVSALERAREVVIAYEPVWAIGTGRNASGSMVAETLVEIRHALARFWPARFADAPILYGGSVTPENVADLVAHGTIAGFLVGGASLDSGKFLSILKGLVSS
ncbi:MAG TPA: triose-phosphate isomerase [Thermoanaerobaculia bacterium]|nr:triose-phosphate isomerase [Thermoanaerobaculia bacterium]